MKKTIIVFAALICCCFSASAQFSLGFGYCNSSFQEKIAYVESSRTSGNGIFVEAGYDARVSSYISILTKAQDRLYRAIPPTSLPELHTCSKRNSVTVPQSSASATKSA